MNVCILSKFPPFQGGISARTYWLARAYAEAGISVHVVSNGKSVENSYRIDNSLSPLPNNPKLTVHEVEVDFPWHIPDEPHSLAKLVDKTLDVVDCHKIDVIDSGYLIPYGIAAFFAYRLSGIPYIVRHGGSDLAKFLKAGRLKNLLKRVLDNAAVIVTDQANETHFAGNLPKKVQLSPYIPDPKFFFPREGVERSGPNLLFAGKVNWHWRRKGLDRILRCIQLLPSDWQMQWIGQGNGEESIREFARNEMNLHIALRRFVSPWNMPDLLQQSDYVFCLSIDEPIPSYSNLLAEALYCSATVVIDSAADLADSSVVCNGLEDRMLRVDSADPESMARSLMQNWGNRIESRMDASIPVRLYDEYRSLNIEILSEAAKKRGPLPLA